MILVGPSGCGKTTILKMIAGLEDISDGELLFDGEIMNDKEPKDRDVGMVFQNYALYPHLSVFDNLAFPLSIKKENKKYIKSRVTEVAESLGLTEYLAKKPKQLSGGQRQRVALGRAIIRKPRVFLFDEPLSNLDAKLRVQMRNEITTMQRNAGTTSVYVTHDQTEAMTMGTKIVVMDKGQIRQIGSPSEIYNNPSDDFVAAFIGSPQINFFDGSIDNSGCLTLKIDGNSTIVLNDYKLINSYSGAVKAGIRPEDIKPAINEKYDFSAKILNVEYLGYEALIHFETENGLKCSRVSNSDQFKYLEKSISKTEGFNINRSKIYLFNNDGSRII